MNRRNFIKHSGFSLGLGSALYHFPFAQKSHFVTPPGNNRVLVLIMLNGGNDGLGTIVPLDQYGNLYKVRPSLMIPENDLLKITDNQAFHPKFNDLIPLWASGQMSIIQNVGYPDQNRSHFRSLDIWTTGSPADEFWNTGWLGRYMDLIHEGFPENFPNEAFPDPIALSMGLTASETCQGLLTNYSIAVDNPGQVRNISQVSASINANGQFGEMLHFMETTLSQSNAYSQRIKEAADSSGQQLDYNTSNPLAKQLKNVAALISGGLQTQIYVCQLNGFDTHANQVSAVAPSEGEHANLLLQLAEAVSTFYNDLSQLGLDEDVLCMTFSEFGRRIKANDSLGTDHGTAGPIFLFGPCLSEDGIMGNGPVIDPDVSIQEGLPMEFDFRDVYGTVLQKWLMVDKSMIRNILHDAFQPLDILNACSDETTSIYEQPSPGYSSEQKLEMTVSPNPFTQVVNLEVLSEGTVGQITIFDEVGKVVKQFPQMTFNPGKTRTSLSLNDLPSNVYYFHLKTEQGTAINIRAVKVN